MSALKAARIVEMASVLIVRWAASRLNYCTVIHNRVTTFHGYRFASENERAYRDLLH